MAYRLKLIALVAGAVFAGAASAQDSVPRCVTNLGPSGLLLAGHFHTVAAFGDGRDVGTPRIADGSGITLFSDIRRGAQFAIYASAAAEMAVVAFLDQNGQVAHTCRVEVAVAEGALPELVPVAVGYCGSNAMAEMIEVDVGETAVFDLPEKYFEGATSPTTLLDHAPVFGARQVELTGVGPGLASFMWLGEDDGDGPLKRLCPVVISE